MNRFHVEKFVVKAKDIFPDDELESSWNPITVEKTIEIDEKIFLFVYYKDSSMKRVGYSFSLNSNAFVDVYRKCWNDES